MTEKTRRSIAIEEDFYEKIKKEGNKRRWNASFTFLQLAKIGYETLKGLSVDVIIKDIKSWQAAAFGDARTSRGACNHLIKEIQEVREELEKDQKTDNLGEEIADCIFMIIQIADLENIDIAKELSNKLTKNKARKWKKPNESGVIEHLK